MKCKRNVGHSMVIETKYSISSSSSRFHLMHSKSFLEVLASNKAPITDGPRKLDGKIRSSLLQVTSSKYLAMHFRELDTKKKVNKTTNIISCKLKTHFSLWRYPFLR